MIERIEVRNYQSLGHIEIEPSRFTVIVGPSSSGKSALTRALKMVSSNQRGDSFVTKGERTAIVTVRTERGTVSLKRGAENEYVLIPTDDPNAQKTFTKLNGAVPAEVTEFLGIAPKDPLNYASQFDGPYLLDDSAGEVARILGALTNVNVIFEGSREANRQRLEANRTLTTRISDLEAIRTRISDFIGLKEQQEHQSAAEDHLVRAVEINGSYARLISLMSTLKIAASSVTSAEEVLSHPDVTVDRITEADERLTKYREVVAAVPVAAQGLKAARAALDEATAEEELLQQQYHERLQDLAGGISEYYAVHSTSAEAHPLTLQPIIAVDEAAQLSADYIVEVLKP